MPISKRFRYFIVISLIALIFEELLEVHNLENKNPFSIKENVDLLGPLINIATVILNMILLGIYFYRKEWKFVFCCLILLDSFTIFLLILDIVYPEFVMTHTTYFILFNRLAYLFFHPLFSVSILITEARKYEWLKLFAYGVLIGVAITFYLQYFEIDYNSVILGYALVLTNTLLIMHFLQPDINLENENIEGIIDKLD